MKKNLEIIDFEHKITKAGRPFVRFNTTDGWISCFDKNEFDELMKFKGKAACVEVVKSGDFSNIKKCHGEATEIPEDYEDKVEVVKPGNVPQSGSKHATMYTSYAKDIFVAMLPFYKDDLDVTETECMQHAIKLVKQAKAAFE